METTHEKFRVAELLSKKEVEGKLVATKKPVRENRFSFHNFGKEFQYLSRRDTRFPWECFSIEGKPRYSRTGIWLSLQSRKSIGLVLRFPQRHLLKMRRETRFLRECFALEGNSRYSRTGIWVSLQSRKSIGLVLRFPQRHWVKMKKEPGIPCFTEVVDQTEGNPVMFT